MVKEGVKLIDKPLRECQFPRNTLIGAVIREADVLIPRGDTRLKAGDRVVLFTVPQMVKKIQKIFQIK